MLVAGAPLAGAQRMLWSSIACAGTWMPHDSHVSMRGPALRPNEDGCSACVWSERCRRTHSGPAQDDSSEFRPSNYSLVQYSKVLSGRPWTFWQPTASPIAPRLYMDRYLEMILELPPRTLTES